MVATSPRSPGQTNGHASCYLPTTPALERFNLLVAESPWRLFEFTSEKYISPLIRQYTQAMAHAQWTTAVPIVQYTSPADLAAHILGDAIDAVIAANKGSKVTVVDFGSGTHPISPFIEHLVNWRRARRKLRPVDFVLSDPRPALDAWIPLSEHSGHLSFIPQSVTAVLPPIAAVSDRFATPDGSTSGSRIVRLFLGNFHQMNNQQAVAALKSAIETADAIVVIEPLDRRLASLLYVVLEFFFYCLITLFWFTFSPVHLLLTYPFPILPSIMSFDRFVSCLRWRTFDEMIQIAVAAEADKPLAASKLLKPSTISTDFGTRHRKLQVGEWYFEGGRTMHTWPLGYMTYFRGWRVGTKQQQS